MKTEVECRICRQKLKISLKKNGKISEKDHNARLKQHLQSLKHRDIWLLPGDSSEKLKRVLKDLSL